ncbi:hypothetical protein RBU60_11850 [Mesonia sp. MT50]|uniref:Uncharacterized protein n=1 Tax=Mesonia profundi TaxID=3070998 RepID=A0ABU1A3L4_9FLAO|nr:hypothetical protein [Mesonia profundi]MDQ7918271.1 hypothetical protein [Mesonia profundi]
MKHLDLSFCGTVGGTVMSVLPILNSQEIMRTIALAVIGAVVSYIVSFIIKAYLNKKE